MVTTPRGKEVPRRAAGGLIRRPALIERLEHGAAGRVTLVAAGAGSGKTELVRSWLGGRPGPAAWVSVERGELDTQRFWSSVVMEVRRAAPGGEIDSLVPTPTFDGAAVVNRVLVQLASLSERTVLVIDDVHELANPDARDQLTQFLDRVPDTLHTVLITRRDVPLGLHRHRLAGELTEIRADDLRFTLEETEAALGAAGIALSQEGLELLQDRTEGWVAGVRLAAISLAASPDREGFVRQFSGSDRTVVEYLMAEVLDGQPPDVRKLLTRASLVGRINGQLGDLLTGVPGAERHLRELADTGGFVVALDPQRTWFRLHQLFADLLLAELRNTEADEMPRLHAAASEWFAEHDEVVEAVTHALAAGDRQRAAGLLVEHYYRLVLDGRQETASGLFRAVAGESDLANAELEVVAATEEQFRGSLGAAAAHLALARRHADAVPPERRRGFATAYLLNKLGLARRRGDFESVLEEVESEAKVPEPHSLRDIALDNDARAVALLNLGVVEVWSGRTDEGLRHLAETRQLARQLGRPYVEVACLAAEAKAIADRSVTRGRDACREAIALAESHGWGSDLVIGPALVTMGATLLMTGRLDQAEEWLGRAAKVLQAGLEPAVGFLFQLSQGSLHEARGENDEAMASLQNAERLGLVLVSGAPLAGQLRSSMLRVRLGRGEADGVRAELDAMEGAERDTGVFREITAMLALADGDAEAAIAVLSPTLDGAVRVHEGAPRVHHFVGMVRSLILAARAHLGLGDVSASHDAVERALELAEEDSLILPFLHIPSRDLLEQHPRHVTRHAALLTDILDLAAGRGRPRESDLAAPLAEPLTDAELRVLRYLPTNLSASEIANEIYSSVYTVRTHVAHIYAKMGTHTRAEAVRRARDLGLLARSSRRA